MLTNRQKLLQIRENLEPEKLQEIKKHFNKNDKFTARMVAKACTPKEDVAMPNFRWATATIEWEHILWDLEDKNFIVRFDNLYWCFVPKA